MGYIDSLGTIFITFCCFSSLATWEPREPKTWTEDVDVSHFTRRKACLDTQTHTLWTEPKSATFGEPEECLIWLLVGEISETYDLLMPNVQLV